MSNVLVYFHLAAGAFRSLVVIFANGCPVMSERPAALCSYPVLVSLLMVAEQKV